MRGDEERKTHGTNSGPMAFGGVLHLLRYQDAVLRLFTTSQLCRVRRSMSHILRGPGGARGRARAATGARPRVDLVKHLIRVLFFHFSGSVCSIFASCAAPLSACLSLSSQWPILHHRWGRQKGETTARLLFGETRSVQLSERRGREGDGREG